MELEIKKIPMPDVHEYTLNELCHFSVPSFIYENLICLKSNEKAGCICRKSGRLIIPFKYDKILIAKNGLLKAFYSTKDGRKAIDFYNTKGSFITDYYYLEAAEEHEEYYIYEDEISIGVITYEDHDEETYSYSCMSKHILSDGKVFEVWGQDLDKEIKESVIKKNISKPMYQVKLTELETSTLKEMKDTILRKFRKYVSSGENPFDDENLSYIDGRIYYSSNGQLKVFDLSRNSFVNLFSAEIECPSLYGATMLTTNNVLFYLEHDDNYNLIFEKDHLILVNENMSVVKFKFGHEIRHKFFVTEEDAENYILQFEEKILDKILKA